MASTATSSQDALAVNAHREVALKLLFGHTPQRVRVFSNGVQSKLRAPKDVMVASRRPGLVSRSAMMAFVVSPRGLRDEIFAALTLSAELLQLLECDPGWLFQSVDSAAQTPRRLEKPWVKFREVGVCKFSQRSESRSSRAGQCLPPPSSSRPTLIDRYVLPEQNPIPDL